MMLHQNSVTNTSPLSGTRHSDILRGNAEINTSNTVHKVSCEHKSAPSASIEGQDFLTGEGLLASQG